MIPKELRETPKLMRLSRLIAVGLHHRDEHQAATLMPWIDKWIADWSREERRRRKARKRRQ